MLRAENGDWTPAAAAVPMRGAELLGLIFGSGVWAGWGAGAVGWMVLWMPEHASEQLGEDVSFARSMSER